MYTMKTIKNLLLAGVIGLSGMLAGCGGGGAGGDSGTGGGTGGGGVTPATTATIFGTTATGAPLPAGTVITIKDATGKTVITSGNTVGANGTFSLSIANPTSYTPPFIIKADPSGSVSGDEHYSVLVGELADSGSYRVNITPVTSLILFEATKKSLATVFSAPQTYLPSLTGGLLDQARDNVVAQFPALNIDNQDFIGQTFSANGTDAYDAAMDAMGIKTIEFAGDVPTLKDENGVPVVYDAQKPLFPIASLTLAAGVTQQVADGASWNLISATVRNTQNEPAKGVTVNFTTTAGTLNTFDKTAATSSAVTDDQGVAKLYLRAGTLIAATVTLTAETGDSAASGTTTVKFIPGVSAVVGLSVSPSTVAPGNATTLSASVLDSNQNKVADGETITFKRVVGAIEVTIGTQTTSNGFAVLSYTAGTTAGTETIRAYAANGASSSPATLTISPAISAITNLSLTSASANLIANGVSSTTLTATARDTHGNGVPGATIAFSASSGTLSTAAATTDSNGVATVSLTAGTDLLTAVVSASANGITTNSNVNFTAGAAASVGINAAPSAVKPGNSSIITVAVIDGVGNAVGNEPINLSFDSRGSGTPSLGATSGVTDANGLLAVSYTAGTITGNDIIRARTSNGQTAVTTINVSQGNIVIGSVVTTASNGSIPVTSGSTVIRAVVRDSANALVSGAIVDFTTTAGALSGATATTDANGVAQITLTAGAQVLTARIEASISGFVGSTNVNFTAGVPNTVVVSAAPNVVNPGDSSTITAYVVDASPSQNPVVGETVTFSIPTKGSGLPTLAVATAVTNVNGLAVVTYTAGAGTGNDTVSARTSNGVSNGVTINVNAANIVIGSVSVSANSSSIAVGTETEIRATVRDSAGQLVPNVSVSFTTSAGVVTTPAPTDANGLAKATLTAGTQVLNATVIATAGGMSGNTQVNFIAGPPTFVTLFAAPAAVQPSGTSVVTVLVQDNNRNAIVGETVALSISTITSGAPSLSIASGQTNASGLLTLTYTAGATGSGSPDIVTARASNGVIGTANISVNGANAVIGSINVESTNPSIPINGSTVIRATVRTTTGAIIPGATVNFATSAGTFGALGSTTLTTSEVTDANGVASVTLTAGTTVLTAQVSASISGFTSTTAVNITAGTAAGVSVNATPNALAPLGTSTITVAVVDGDGNAVANEPVSLSLPASNSGNPSLSATSGNTDANGLLRVTYTAGATSGLDQIKAVVSTGIPATANITVAAGTPTVGSLVVSATNSSVPVVTGSSDIRAVVRDDNGQVLSGLTVAFAIRDGSGVLSATTAVTDATGLATVRLSGTTITVPQAVRVDATVSGFTRSAIVDFVADRPAAISLVAMPNAVKPNGSTTLVVAVVDQEGNPVANEKVTLSIERDPLTGFSPSGLSCLSGVGIVCFEQVHNANDAVMVTGNTSANGFLTVSYIAGGNSGVSDVIRAVTSNGIAAPPLSISVNNSNIVIGSVAVSAVNPSIVVGQSTTIRATVRDSAGAVVPNYPVSFTSSAGVISAATNTDANGLATATLTAGNNVQSATVTATAGGMPGRVDVGFTAGVADTVVVRAAPNTVNPGVSSTISAYVVDADLNPVVGESVTFSITSQGSGLPTLAVATALTNANGLAVVTYTAGEGTGTDTVSAVAGNAVLGTTNITVSSSATVVGSVTLISGATTLPADGASSVTLRATVLTSSGTPASGVTVNFSTSGGSLSDTSVQTDASGIAETTLTSPVRTGTISVVAEASGFLASEDIAIVSGQPTAAKFVLTASPAAVNAGGVSALTAIVLDANDNPVVGQTVTFTITTNTSNGSLSPVTATTSSNGIATSIYTGGDTLGTDTIRAALVGGLTKTTTVVVTGDVVNALSIATDRTTVKTDGSEIATITVTALSSQNVVVPGVTISFAASGGQLNASQVVTNASGQAQVNLSAGAIDKSNRTVTVTASATGVTDVQIPVRVVDSTVALVTTNSTLTAGGSSISVTVTARDASGLGIFNTPVTLAQSGGGSVSITSASGNTDVNGQFTTTLTGVAPGSVTLTATGLGASASQILTVTPGSTFAITAPADDPAGLTTSGTLVFTVNAPTQTSVRFATTLGAWAGVDRFGVACTSVCEKSVLAGASTATLASANTGTANIQLDGLDVGGNVTGTDTHTVLVTASASSSISLQGAASNVPPSSGGTVNTVALTATVRDAFGQPVGGVPVAFSILNTTSGGETISPVVKLSSDGVNSTDPLGQARTTFTSGSLPSGQSNASIRIQAKALDSGATATFNIVVGGAAASLAIGGATEIERTSTTQYTYPMSVLVADSNGNPAPAGTVVSLSIWPVAYSTGVRASNCAAVIDDIDPLVDSDGDLDPANDADATYLNEDINENLILDAGEDTPPFGNGDGLLTPSNSSAGTLPSVVPTNVNGVANFNLVYLKEFADWVVVRVRANALVQGTETTTQLVFRLPAALADATPCTLSNSPFFHP